MIFSTKARLFFEANFENSFSAIAEKNTILVYLCAASTRFWWRSRTRIFRKTFISNVPWIWNSTTIHIRSIFQKKFCWLGLAVRISSEWQKKSQPSKMMISWLFSDKYSCILTTLHSVPCIKYINIRYNYYEWCALYKIYVFPL